MSRRQTRTNPRALGTNPRALGTAPRQVARKAEHDTKGGTGAASAIDWTRYFSLSTLLERGWTRSAIGALLGAPDTVEPNPFNPDAHPMRLYAIERVRHAETSWEWRGWRDHGIDRKIDRYERHTQSTQP
jgi:hypothetical protein